MFWGDQNKEGTSMLQHTYRRRPSPDNIAVDAVQLTADNVDEVASWCSGHKVIEHDALDHEKTFVGINVPTCEGVVRASEGDYIIKDVMFEFHVRRPGDFESKYERL